MSSNPVLKVYMPVCRGPPESIIGPVQCDMTPVKLDIQSLDKWHQAFEEHCPFVPPWSGSSEDVEAGKQAPERSLLGDTQGGRSGDDVPAREEANKVEECEKRRLVRMPPFADGARASELSSYGLQGWPLLHKIIRDGLSSADASRIPYWLHQKQRAYLISVKQGGADWSGDLLIAEDVQSLETCPRNSLMALLDRVEKRGWRDIIWLGTKGDAVPFRFNVEDNAETMVWS